jgi:hypothetical protein
VATTGKSNKNQDKGRDSENAGANKRICQEYEDKSQAKTTR